MTVPSGIVDLHSHLIPGVDDGSETVEGALDALRAMADDGVVRLVTTPHLNAHLTRDAEILSERLDEIDVSLGNLRAAMADDATDLPELLRGHEVALDDPQPVFEDPRLRLAQTDFVLVEWAYMKLPVGRATIEVLDRIVAAGWIPVLAHPERYKGVAEHLPLVEAWRKAGALLQVNHGSILGAYGRQVQANARYLLDRGFADVLSSDYHGWAGRPPGVSDVREWFDELDRHDVFEILTRHNPGRLLAGELPSPVPALSTEGGESAGILERLRRRFLGSPREDHA